MNAQDKAKDIAALIMKLWELRAHGIREMELSDKVSEAVNLLDPNSGFIVGIRPISSDGLSVTPGPICKCGHPTPMALIWVRDDAQETDHCFNVYACDQCGRMLKHQIWEDAKEHWIEMAD